MSEIEEYYLDLMRFLALPANEQGIYLEGGVPDQSSRSAGEFPEGRNLLVDLARTILDACPKVELAGDDEIHSEMLEVLTLLLASKESRFWSLSGLKSSAVWRLLRKLARNWLKSAGDECRAPGRSVLNLLK